MVRPLKESGSGRTVAVNVRMIEAEKEMLETLADARGLDQTKLIITLIKEDTERRKELLEMFRKMQELRQQ